MHQRFMKAALRQAQRAMKEGEVPIGAVLVLDGKIAGRGYNLRESRNNPLAHAELRAIAQAARRLKSWRLGGTLYTTLEPCPMCAGAIIQARIENLVYGAKDPKAGACGSILNLFEPGLFNHNVEVTGGVVEHECQRLLEEFFEALRS